MLNQFIKFSISFISLLIPVKRNLFLYGSWFGTKYGDNARYFFEFVSKNHPEIDSYWITKESDIALQLSSNGYNVIQQGSIKALWLHLRAQAVFCNTSHESDLWGLMLNRKTLVFNLWHGTPIKKIGFDALDSNIDKAKLGVSARRSIKSLLPKALFSSLKAFVTKKTYYLASSEVVSKVLQSAMGAKQTDIIIEGYPKLDHLINAEKNLASGNILYAPTYRGTYNSENDLLTEFGFEPEQVNTWLQQNNKQLVIRLHPANNLPEDIADKLNDFSHIRVGDSRDLYESLIDYELVITDFSSLYYDCLAINVPVLLAPFGLESYIQNDRPLYFTPEELYPYATATDWPSLIELLPTLYQEKRDLTAIRNKFYCEHNGQASKKLFDKINQLLIAK